MTPLFSGSSQATNRIRRNDSVKYYGKIKKGAGVKSASQFYELEGYFLSLVRCTILENIPFIGELDYKW